ncbi:hypothetical protein GCM10010168_48580 [Actinoplanes ianthinogenes]|uniref:SnoaL-like domain-containing protein n=1 Tax=Actinoplanes ianthinogenes TaxID=122358 RepID=A0ABN6C6Y0_9ACTN|nr:hypothetical protein [Actinoplanes ianthinogenes]BCJ40843.1 hypothetical protein Aiant_15000 [Actinoplanes ianthinogenes]GGR24842.1 hypothetical protein GCM10010168_48580 [Actinoplanes ianthinogenes]
MTDTKQAADDLRELVDRYVALWGEPDPEHRRAAIRDLWTADAVHVLKPPEEMRTAAAALGFDDQVLEARGHAALEVRVTRAYQEFVAPGTFEFRALGDADRLADVVKFRWEMVPRAGGDAAGTGLEILLLAPDGRITRDYQFIE